MLISKEQKECYFLRFKYGIYSEIRSLFHERGETYENIATILGWSKNKVKKTLKGEKKISIKNLNDLSRALNARLEPKITKLETLGCKIYKWGN